MVIILNFHSTLLSWRSTIFFSQQKSQLEFFNIKNDVIGKLFATNCVTLWRPVNSVRKSFFFSFFFTIWQRFVEILLNMYISISGRQHSEKYYYIADSWRHGQLLKRSKEKSRYVRQLIHLSCPRMGLIFSFSFENTKFLQLWHSRTSHHNSTDAMAN